MTRNEQKLYNDVGRIADALESLARAWGKDKPKTLGQASGMVCARCNEVACDPDCVNYELRMNKPIG